ncbi:unnamed protein product [Phaedon cochleariae]|uniref:Uncharacterized protein n=1 Tax=Phaedon cochleariae TaxID=80249 RepID=A0A9N9WXP2_PHACE|nr:unnamed protein product [Phaedon cochleariae]
MPNKRTTRRKRQDKDNLIKGVRTPSDIEKLLGDMNRAKVYPPLKKFIVYTCERQVYGPDKSDEFIIYCLSSYFILGVECYHKLPPRTNFIPIDVIREGAHRDFKINAGLKDNLVQLIKIKTENLSTQNKTITLSMDEISLSPGVKYDENLDLFIGYEDDARRLAQEGAKVVISSRKQKNVDEALKALREQNLEVTGLTCHVASPEDRKNLFQEATKLGGLDILISNAAVNPEVAKVLDCSEKSWDKIFDVNVKSSFLLAKESLPLLRRSKHGRIVFISSISGFTPQAPFDELGAYAVSKTALFGLTKAAASQLGKDNITVNSIAPGIIQTKFSEILTTEEGLREEGLKRIPLNRFGQPDEIAGTAAFLASDDAAYITGENIVVAGGMNSRI